MALDTKKLDEIRVLRQAAASTAAFWPTWREKYLPDTSCDKKGASFTRPDDRFASFSFQLMFSSYAGYYGNSSCSRVFSLNNDLARKYFTQAIQEMAVPLFQRASELMLAEAASLTEAAEQEVAALQAMLDEVRAAGGEPESEAA